MNDYWEHLFCSEEIPWGTEASDSAFITRDLFLEHSLRKVLIPGIGYGRNARIFIDRGLEVTGIEISGTAIMQAKKYLGPDTVLYHGSVTEMPFDTILYEGIYCYALIHLLNKPERNKFIKACFDQLKPGGYMVFSVISVNSAAYGEGRELSPNRFCLPNGLCVYFYNTESVQTEFGNYGLQSFSELEEPIKYREGEIPLQTLLIKCKRE